MARETGKVNDDLEPIIRLRLANGAGIDCVVDTGFNGAVMLPASFVAANNLPITGSQEFKVVGRAEPHRAAIAFAEVYWLADKFEVQIAVSSEGFALLGAEMLIDSTLVINYVDSLVTIDKRTWKRNVSKILIEGLS